FRFEANKEMVNLYESSLSELVEMAKPIDTRIKEMMEAEAARIATSSVVATTASATSDVTSS
ncbi:hypothetical protein HHI36_017103, partial [Cryptolaemus montrouzieri]